MLRTDDVLDGLELFIRRETLLDRAGRYFEARLRGGRPSDARANAMTAAAARINLEERVAEPPTTYATVPCSAARPGPT